MSTVEFDINITELPSTEELKHLFTQTTWASKRDYTDINKMLESHKKSSIE